jgi:fluoride exporter
VAAYAAVALGGAAGSLLRYWVGVALVSRLGAAFPWGTLVVNLTGSFAIGLAMGLLSPRSTAWLLAVTGFLGGFTTFSTFEAETMALLRAGAAGRAAAYVGASVGAGLAACWLGARLTSLVAGPR